MLSQEYTFLVDFFSLIFCYGYCLLSCAVVVVVAVAAAAVVVGVGGVRSVGDSTCHSQIGRDDPQSRFDRNAVPS